MMMTCLMVALAAARFVATTLGVQPLAFPASEPTSDPTSALFWLSVPTLESVPDALPPDDPPQPWATRTPARPRGTASNVSDVTRVMQPPLPSMSHARSDELASPDKTRVFVVGASSRSWSHERSLDGAASGGQPCRRGKVPATFT